MTLLNEAVLERLPAASASLCSYSTALASSKVSSVVSPDKQAASVILIPKPTFDKESARHGASAVAASRHQTPIVSGDVGFTMVTRKRRPSAKPGPAKPLKVTSAPRQTKTLFVLRLHLRMSVKDVEDLV